MHTPVLRLIDLGDSDEFSKSMSFAQSLLSSINVGFHRADIEYMRVGNLNLAARAMTQRARLIHVMAHGITDEDGQPGFQSDDEEYFFGLGDLAAYLHEEGQGIEADGIFADSCGSAQQRFVSSLRHSLEAECTYIGSTRAIGWHEATTFASILYGALLSKRGKGFTGCEWVAECGERSIGAYEMAVDGNCPFKVTTLHPSRQAKKAFAGNRRGLGLD